MAGQGDQSKMTIHGRGITYGQPAQEAIRVETAAGVLVSSLGFDGKTEDGGQRHKATQLTNTQVLALATGAGSELIAAPGANKAIIVHSVFIVADAADTAWTEPSAPDELVVQYADGVDITASIEAGVLVANNISFVKYGVLDTEIVPDVNAAVMLFNNGSNWGGGDVLNSMSVMLWYSIVNTVKFPTST